MVCTFMHLWTILALVANFEYKHDAEKDYCVIYKSYEYYGKLDVFGNFMQNLNTSLSQLPEDVSNRIRRKYSRNYIPLVMAGWKNNVYEFRSNRLIPGTVQLRQFVPDIGGKVIPIAEYNYPWHSRYIFNLPGQFVPTVSNRKKWPVGKHTQHPKDSPKTNPVPQPRKEEDHEFKLTPNVAYSRQFGNMMYYGTLDEFGNFVPSPTIRGMDVTKGMPKDADKYIPLMSHIKQKQVYEFRSWTLIPGIIENGEFLPDLDNKIIDFADYRYSKDAKPIYNLPGKFFPVGKEK